MALRWPRLGFSSHFLQAIYLSLQKTSASPLSLSIYLSKYRAPLKFQLYLRKKNAILVPAPYCPRRWCWCQTAPYTRRRESWLLTKYSFSLVREPAAAQLPTHGLGLLSCLPPQGGWVGTKVKTSVVGGGSLALRTCLLWKKGRGTTARVCQHRIPSSSS